MADERDPEERGFKVNDRRKFTADGELRAGVADEPAAPEAAPAPVPPAPAPQARPAAPPRPAAVETPRVTPVTAARPAPSARPAFPGAMRTGPSASFSGPGPAGSSSSTAPRPAPGPADTTPAGPTPEDHAAQAQYHGESPEDAATIDFPQFVLATARLAAMFLGDIPSPQSGRPELNLGAAKQQIDLLGMLQEKTRGNLQREEEQLMQALLTELRLRFVEIRQQVSKGGKRGA